MLRYVSCLEDESVPSRSAWSIKVVESKCQESGIGGDYGYSFLV